MPSNPRAAYVSIPMEDFDALRAYVRNVTDAVLDDDLFTDAPEKARAIRYVKYDAKKLRNSLLCAEKRSV
jgi:hypothetical protein